MMITISNFTIWQYPKFHSLVMISGDIRFNTSSTEQSIWVQTKQVKWWEQPLNFYRHTIQSVDFKTSPEKRKNSRSMRPLGRRGGG